MENKNIVTYEKLIKPHDLSEVLPTDAQITGLVTKTRREIAGIICGAIDKMLFVVGPCSVHNVNEAYAYGRELRQLAKEVEDKILIVMRVYFEKPRTTVGWKGLINDPELNSTFKVNDGLYLARKLLIDLNKLGLPCGYEILDTITPQYISELVSWGAIGARTTESQVHRQLVSGMSMPVGFKNGTGGSINIAADAILSARYSHCFMGITQKGEPAICTTKGNQNTHLILRGGAQGPNYSEPFNEKSEGLLRDRELSEAIMVDCSHGNSGKDHTKQCRVLENVIAQRYNGRKSIMGVMMESNINEGKQTLADPGNLKHGVSVTDSCMSIGETRRIILAAYHNLKRHTFVDVPL